MSRRVFMHIDEYGDDGFAQLPYFVCVSDPLVLWAPSALLLQKAREAGVTDLSSRDLIRLINSENAPIRVIAREQWFDPVWRNTHPFEGARWVPQYDGLLARFAEDDKKLAIEHRRVIVASPEKGYDIADQLLVGSQKKSLEAKLGNLYRKRLLPQGTLEKASRDIDVQRPYVRTVVRDLVNHYEAKSEARAAIAATPCERLLLLASVIQGARGVALTTTEVSAGSADATDTKQAIGVLQKLAPCVSKQHLFKFLRSDLRRDLHDLLFAARGSKSLELHLITKMREATNVPVFLNRFLPKRDPIGATVTLGGLMLTLATTMLTGKLTFGLLPVLAEALKGPAIRRSLIPAPVPWGDKTRSLFYFSLGTKRPTLSRVEQLCTWLGDPRVTRRIGAES